MGEREANRQVIENTRERLEACAKALAEVAEELRRLSISTPADSQQAINLDGDARTIEPLVRSVLLESQNVNAAYSQYILNIVNMYEERHRPDEEDYERKKLNVKLINFTLREDGLCIQHPDTAEPCSLHAVGSDDGNGRYVLESRVTRKRSRASRSLMDLLPFRLMPEPPKQESFADKKKRRDLFRPEGRLPKD